jgi:glycosyltransferase involved in cell wall biosynthesis/peptidoglycan/xylan/chitin deacetylase (PgdA/CDA1 family)
MITQHHESPKRATRLLAKSILAWVLRLAGLLGIAEAWVRRHGTIVLTFHRVLTDQELQETASLPGMVVRRETFDHLLKFLSSEYRIVDLAHYPDGSPSSKLRIAITFDDGWYDNRSSAYPIARAYGVPMTIFIVPGRIGTHLPFWPERVALAQRRNDQNGSAFPDRLQIEQLIESLGDLPAEKRRELLASMALPLAPGDFVAAADRTMDWQDVAELRKGGVTFGSHTCTHEILTTLPPAACKDEVTSSRELIERQLGTPCPLISYPNGSCSPETRDIVAASGHKFGFLNQEPGVWTPDCDPYLIPRVNVSEGHLVDRRGCFSPLIFRYTVVWRAAKGLALGTCRRSAARLSAGLQKLDQEIGVKSRTKTPLPVPAVASPMAKPVPPIHVLFLIDHLVARGGGEGNLLKVVELLPHELFRCSIATFRVNPEIQKNISVPVHVLRFRRAYDLSAIKAAYKLRRLIKKERVDIVHTYFESSNLLGGLVTKLSGAALLSSRRDMGILRSAKHMLAYRFVNPFSDRTLAVSEEVKKHCIEEDRIKPDKISVVYNGVDLRQVDDSVRQVGVSSPEWAQAEHIVTCVANIRQVKGIDILVRTAQIVCREMPGTLFLVAGSTYGEEAKEIQSLVHSLGLDDAVKFLGFVENPVPVLKMSNAFCLLSRSEGFCNALLEAMACGIASVVTHVGGNPEAINNGENGFLVPVEDAQAAAERLLLLLRDPALAIKIGKAARATVESRFSAETMIQNLIGIYNDLLAHRKNAKPRLKTFAYSQFRSENHPR